MFGGDCAAFLDSSKTRSWDGHIQISIVIPTAEWRGGSSAVLRFGPQVTGVDNCWNIKEGSSTFSGGMLSFELDSAPNVADQEEAEIGCIMLGDVEVAEALAPSLTIGGAPCLASPPPPPASFAPCVDAMLKVDRTWQAGNTNEAAWQMQAHIGVVHWVAGRTIRLDFGPGELEVQQDVGRNARQHVLRGEASGIVDLTLLAEASLSPSCGLMVADVMSDALDRSRTAMSDFKASFKGGGERGGAQQGGEGGGAAGERNSVRHPTVSARSVNGQFGDSAFAGPAAATDVVLGRSRHLLPHTPPGLGGVGLGGVGLGGVGLGGGGLGGGGATLCRNYPRGRSRDGRVRGSWPDAGWDGSSRGSSRWCEGRAGGQGAVH